MHVVVPLCCCVVSSHVVYTSARTIQGVRLNRMSTTIDCRSAPCCACSSGGGSCTRASFCRPARDRSPLPPRCFWRPRAATARPRCCWRPRAATAGPACSSVESCQSRAYLQQRVPKWGQHLVKINKQSGSRPRLEGL